MKRAFLICPVRGIPPETWQRYVREIELRGDIVHLHFPPRDTDQEDETGYRICQDNLEALKKADVVFVIWDGKSQGCLFDLGMAFALGKEVIPLQLPPETEGKSFQNMIQAWADLAKDGGE